MEQDFVVELYDNLCNVLNENPLPISVKYFILKDLFNETRFLYDNYRKQIQQHSQEEEQQESIKIDVPVEIDKTVKEQ